jgi:methylase of polypeptide subunit release factors
MDTFTASLASIPVNDRFFVSIRAVCQPDGLIRACLNTGVAACAGCIAHPRNHCTDDADICDLGTGAGIGAITQSDAEYVVVFDVVSQRCFEKS